MEGVVLWLLLNVALASGYLFNLNLNRRTGVSFEPIRNYSNSLPHDQYFTQKLDHFDPTNEDTWLQRYWQNSSYYKKGGPAFLMINGEQTVSAEWAMTGQWITYAEDLQAVCFSLEHRFYGNSRPKNDTSTENLVYLSSEQALADIAYFIKGVTKLYQLPSDIKWIVFGGSYAGGLAAWARLKYPYLVHGAVSSSGPLLAKIDFDEYFQVVKDSLDSYNPKCSAAVALANKELEVLIRSDSGRDKLASMFRLCNKLESDPDDISFLFANLADNFAEVVQYNKDNVESATQSITIETLCDIMDSGNGTAVSLYADVNTLMMNAYDLKCLDHRYKEYIKELQKKDYESAEGTTRQWIYQTCTEFGYYQSSSKVSETFSSRFPASFFTKQCEQIFGQKFKENLLENAVNHTNTIYGDLKINVDNIIFVHGSIDPWHALGITHVQDEDSVYQTIYINGTAHCADMLPSSDNDIEELKLARAEILKSLRNWVQKSKPKQNTKKYFFKVMYKNSTALDGVNP